MRITRSPLVLLVSALLLSACKDSTTPVQTVPVRIVNVSSGTTGTVDVFSGTTSLATGLAFRGSMTTFITTPTTNTRFRLTTVNTPGTVRSDTGTTPLTFPTNGVTTVVFTEAGTPAGATFAQVNPCS